MKKLLVLLTLLIGLSSVSQNSESYNLALYDYMFTVKNQLITAYSTNSDYPTIESRDLAAITNEIQRTRIDPFKNTHGSFDISLYFRGGIFNSYSGILFKGGYPTNTEATRISITMVGEDATTTQIRCNKINGGYDIVTFTDGLRGKFKNFRLTAASGNGKALYLKAPSQTGGFSVRDFEIDQIYTYHSTTGYSIVMENIFSVMMPRIKATNFLGSGIDFRNNSKTTNYGNSLAGKIDVRASGNKGTTAFKISTLKNSGKRMNLLNIGYLEIGCEKGEGGGGASKGVHFENASNVTIGMLTSEYLGENIHFENTSNVTVNNITATIEKATGQKDGESYGVWLDNCSNVKLLNGNYYTTDYTTRPLIVNDNPYKHGNVIYGELKNGLNTNSIDDENKINTEVHMFQNGTLDDVTTP